MKSERFRAAPTIEPIQIAIDDVIPEGSLPEAETAIVKTYEVDEYPIDVVTEDSTITKESIRVLIGIRDQDLNGSYILILSNNKIYLTKSVKANRLLSSEELSVGKILAMDTIIKLHSEQIKLMSVKLNEHVARTEKSRRLIGSCDYFVLNDDQLKQIKAKDLQRCFHYERGRWLYYSEALESWVLFPKGWQKLTNVERYNYDLRLEVEANKDNKDFYEVGETVGCLDTNKCYQWNGEVWEEIADPKDEFGDEYVVKYMAIRDYTSGILVYSATGWLYL